MKMRMLSLLAAMLLLTGCAAAQPPDTPTSTSEETSSYFEENETDAPITVVLPGGFFSSEDRENFNAAQYAREQGYLSAIMNTDGSVSVEMSPEKYAQLWRKFQRKLDTQIAKCLRSPDTAYILEIERDEDYSLFQIRVDKKAYETAFDVVPASLLLDAALLNVLREEPLPLRVEIIDDATDEILQTEEY